MRACAAIGTNVAQQTLFCNNILGYALDLELDAMPLYYPNH